MLGDCFIEIHEKHSFKFQPLNVLNIEHAYIPIVADDLAILASDRGQIDFLQSVVQLQSERFDLLFLVDENCDRGGLLNHPINLMNPLGQPLRDSSVVAEARLPDGWQALCIETVWQDNVIGI